MKEGDYIYILKKKQRGFIEDFSMDFFALINLKGERICNKNLNLLIPSIFKKENNDIIYCKTILIEKKIFKYYKKYERR